MAGLSLAAASMPVVTISSAPAVKGRNKDIPFELGMASYTFRHFPLEDALEMTRRLNIKNIAFKSMHLPLDSTREEILAVREKTKETGLNLYGAGVVYMKNEEEVNNAFEYAATAGMKVIIGVPEHELLELVDRKVKEYNIKLAIHNHGPGDERYPSPESIIEKVRHLDRRVGMCMDIGHTQRIGIDPALSAERFFDRMHDVHMKDVSSSTAEGHTVETGRGVIDIPAFLSVLVDKGYTGKVSFEFEKDEKDPLPGLAESVGYVRGVLEMMKRNRL